MNNYNRAGRYIKHKLKEQGKPAGFLVLEPKTPPRDGELWNQEEDSRLLDAVLLSPKALTEFVRRRDGSALCKSFGRSYDSLRTRAWKLVTGYRQSAVGYQPDDYKPVGRGSRSGQRFTGSDRWLIMIAVEEAIKSDGTVSPARLARVLARTAAEVKDWMVKEGLV